MNALRWMLAVLLLIFVFVLGGLGVFWALGASQGAEWDYCGGSAGCRSGESIGFALLIPAGTAAFLGRRLVPRKRRS